MKLFYTTSIDDVKLTIAEKNKINIIKTVQILLQIMLLS
jgi:ribosomal protein L7/L12